MTKYMDAKKSARLYVIAQFVLLADLLLAPADVAGWGPAHDALAIVGLVAFTVGILLVFAAGFGLGKSLTAMPIPKDDGHLVEVGLYKHVRHPIYSGLLLLALGLVFSNGPWPQLLIWALLFLVLNRKARFEEDFLRKKYTNYLAYAAETPRFLPRVVIRKSRG
jgi:protein-S-isoprenylcysteine O-methyltransferase Ste14